jgi:hypothetical protein
MMEELATKIEQAVQEVLKIGTRDHKVSKVEHEKKARQLPKIAKKYGVSPKVLSRIIESSRN